MSDRKTALPKWGPKDYWRIGPVYVRKQLALLAVIVLSAAILAIFGLPFRMFQDERSQIPAYRYDDSELAGISGLVQVLDDEDRVRYVGEVELGAYTGRGKVFNEAGELLYDGPLVDGVYEGPDAKVYQSGVLVYTGEMAGNLYEGQGRRINPATGIVSEGQFSRGLLEGQGQEFYADGTLLREGAFSRDLLEGEGYEYSADSVLLREGTFSAGLLHGAGREYTGSGKLRYEGQFWRGIYYGQGTLYNTLLDVRSVEGTFVYGRLRGQGTIYHPSGQLLYTGQVYGDRPRADAFLALSLAEVEEAFTTHWLLYSCNGVTAFVYPYFNLMFVTESPVDLVSPTRAAEESERERQELLEALEQPAAEGLEDTKPENVESGSVDPEGVEPDDPELDNDELEDAGEKEPVGDLLEPPGSDPGLGGAAAEKLTAQMLAYSVPASAVPVQPVVYDDEILSADTDKRAIIITQVLSYREQLPCVAQPNYDFVSGRHRPGWREWFSDFALGKTVQGVSVRQSGQFIWRFTPWSALEADDGDCIDEFLAENAGVETMTVRKGDKDMSLWYQTAKWRDEP